MALSTKLRSYLEKHVREYTFDKSKISNHFNVAQICVIGNSV